MEQTLNGEELRSSKLLSFSLVCSPSKGFFVSLPLRRRRVLLCRRPLRSRFTQTVWRPPRVRTHGDEKIRACKIRTKHGRGVHLLSHRICQVSSCSSKNITANSIRHFLLQISPIFQFLYLAGCSEAKKSQTSSNGPFGPNLLRLMLQKHILSYVLLSRSFTTSSFFISFTDKSYFSISLFSGMFRSKKKSQTSSNGPFGPNLLRLMLQKHILSYVLLSRSFTTPSFFISFHG
jgi:hypothetical protein